MVTQHETGPMQPNALAQETVNAVRRALQRYEIEAPASEPASELRVALRALAQEARLKAVPPEKLLIILKGIWQALPELENARDEVAQTRALQRIVTICIKEYFAS
jgi:hypothetical protein